MALSLLATGVCAGELRVADAGAPFCDDIAALRPYITARANRTEDALSRLTGCRMLRGGWRVEVSHDYPGLGGKIHLLHVRVYDGDPVSDGYMYGNGLVMK